MQVAHYTKLFFLFPPPNVFFFFGLFFEQQLSKMSDVVCDSLVGLGFAELCRTTGTNFRLKMRRGLFRLKPCSSYLIYRLHANIYFLPSAVHVCVTALHERNASSSLPFPVYSSKKKKGKTESHGTVTDWNNG